MGRLKFENAPDVEIKANELVGRLGMEHIDCSRLRFMRSRGSKGRALAPEWGNMTWPLLCRRNVRRGGR